MTDLIAAKQLVRKANQALDAAGPDDAAAALSSYTNEDYLWRGMFPFHEKTGAQAVTDAFWSPLKNAMGQLQRRPDIFFAGRNQIDNWTSIWVVEMGHLLGHWDNAWIGLAPSHKISLLRYCEFHRVANNRICETACYVDILNLLAQSGRSPIPETSGLQTVTPGPRTHDGLIYNSTPEGEGRVTVELIAVMITDLRSNRVHSPNDHLSQFWTEDMCWFGPGGIGASAFYDCYRRGHCDPFEAGLEYVRHTEHIARLGEGNFGGFFGYPSLTLRSKGYLGLPASDIEADMRIVDLYRREGDKLAENWIFIQLRGKPRRSGRG